MTRTRVNSAGFLLIFVLAGGCGGSVEGVWVGEYDSILTHTTSICGDAPREPSDEAATLILESGGSSGLVMQGRCPFPVRAISATAAEFVGYSCDRVIDGTELHVRVVGGSMQLHGVRLTGNLSLEITSPDGGCVLDEMVILGDRL